MAVIVEAFDGRFPDAEPASVSVARPLGELDAPGRLNHPGCRRMIGEWVDRQDLADWLAPAHFTMYVDERHRHLAQRSSSAIAEYDRALRGISLTWRSSRFSRSSAFIRSATSLGIQARSRYRSRPSSLTRAASASRTRSSLRSVPPPPTRAPPARTCCSSWPPPNHPLIDDQVERTNRTIKEATVKCFYHDGNDQRRTHRADPIAAYSFAC